MLDGKNSDASLSGHLPNMRCAYNGVVERILPTIRGRGAQVNPVGRFERLELVIDEDLGPEERPSSRTQFFSDSAKTLITSNTSPDIPFTYSINPYRGCEHGCSYCFARNGHNYFNLSAGLDFETKIFLKLDAPELLRKELLSPSWRPEPINISGVTDCYQPIERKLEITRRCLGVLAEFRQPATFITKNHLIVRDADHLAELARYNAVAVLLSITTLDTDLAGKMEPRASSPARRLDAIRLLASAGVPVGVMVAPVIPGLTDHEIPSILSAAADAGAQFAAHSPLRLPQDVAVVFEDWLSKHLPDRMAKVLNKIRDMRGGKLNDPRFGNRMKAQGALVEQIKSIFTLAKRKTGLDKPFPALTTEHFRRPSSQLSLFD